MTKYPLECRCANSGYEDGTVGSGCGEGFCGRECGEYVVVGVIAYGSDPRNATVFEGVSEGSSLKSDGSTELPVLEISS
jgi:hypothetical protein